MAKESQERQYIVRRERCLAQQLTAADIDADRELAAKEKRPATLAGAEPGDYFVTQVGFEPRVWGRSTFDEHFELDTSDAKKKADGNA